MSDYQKTVMGCIYVVCDARDCGRRTVSPCWDARTGGTGLDTGREFFRRLAADGWTFWVSRSRRAYCPAHGPRPGHRMRDITAHYRGSGY